MKRAISSMLATLSTICGDASAYSERHVLFTRYNLPRRGVKKKRTPKVAASRARSKAAQAMRRRQRRMA